MAQLFPPIANTYARGTIYGAILLFSIVIWWGAQWNRSPWWNMSLVARQQPLQFSHRHHVGDDGIDCRYCHNSVEQSSYAGIPPTKTCMNCHSQIWDQSPMLAPVRQSFTTGAPLLWSRVHDLPDFVYFDHSIHVAKGVGCSTCHGQVDDMPLVWPVADMQMKWCLQCHRDPARVLRPRSAIYDMHWQPPPDQAQVGQRLMAEYGIRSARDLTSCNTCHR